MPPFISPAARRMACWPIWRRCLAVVMPAGLLGLVAMPFGFDGVFWWLMGIGIDWMIVVTQWVTGLPGAIGRMAAFGIGPLIAASAGIVLLGLLRTPLRWAGAAVLVLAVAGRWRCRSLIS